MKKTIILLILTLTIAQATDYYADINIKIDNQGYTTITGNTNYPNLTTTDNPTYTSKKANYWTFNMTKPEQFSEFIYAIQLPETASINYIKTTGTFTITNNGNNLEIKGYGENKPLEITIQYQINKETSNLLIMAVAIIPLIIITAGAHYLYKKKKKAVKKQTKKKTNKKTKKENTAQKKKIKLPPLPKRQKKIIQLLIDKKKPLTQAQIRKELQLPKASTTRNINALELKGLITKEKIGITNLIKIKK